MATIKKVKKAQMGSSVVNPYAKMAQEKMESKRDSIGPKLSPAKISVTEKQVGAQKEKAKKAVTSPVRPLKKGGKVKKAQKGKKLPLGASSASAESDYAKSDSLRNKTKNLTSKDIWDMNSKGQRPSDLFQKSDSLKREGDRKTKATGGVPRDYRLKKGGVAKKKMNMGGMMKKGGKMSKKK